MALHRKHEDPEEARDLDINPVYVQVPDHVVTRDPIPEHSHPGDEPAGAESAREPAEA